MLINHRRGWEIPESQVTPEPLVMRRRQLLGGALLGAGAIGAGIAWPRGAFAADMPAAAAGSAQKYPAGRPITDMRAATTYNNFYEFGTDKSIWQAAQKLPQSPWSITIDGMVDKPRTIALDDLVKQMPIEDRVYRHRCVEAWAMTVPWTGFPLSRLLALAAPQSGAKYVVFQTLADRKVMPGLRQIWYPWPYTDGLTMPEASNDLAFIVTGMYGKALPPQDGGPIRLHVPWKYGFKSVKSIARVTFTDKQPDNFWQKLQSSEYGFWANVNPAVPHPRWSQESERLLGTGETVPTVIYNGYGPWVAGLYANMPTDRLFM